MARLPAAMMTCPAIVKIAFSADTYARAWDLPSTGQPEQRDPMNDGSAQDLPWEREELILACDLVARNGWRQLAPTDPRVVELSELLKRLPLHPLNIRRENFRNTNSVVRKTADIVTSRPGYPGRPTKGGRSTKRVTAEFMTDETAMKLVAELIREAEARGEFARLEGPVADEQASATEGRLLIRRHVAYERNPALRKRKLAAVLRTGKSLACEACGFDFEDTYGERGKGYIECHHVVPLHVAPSRITRLSDLVLLCANCHRVIHARPPWLTLAELRALIRPTP